MQGSDWTYWAVEVGSTIIKKSFLLDPWLSSQGFCVALSQCTPALLASQPRVSKESALCDRGDRSPCPEGLFLWEPCTSLGVSRWAAEDKKELAKQLIIGTGYMGHVLENMPGRQERCVNRSQLFGVNRPVGGGESE